MFNQILLDVWLSQGIQSSLIILGDHSVQECGRLSASLSETHL
jgi:hypothetical protein